MKKETWIKIKRKIAMVLAFAIVLQLCSVQTMFTHAEDTNVVEVNVVDGQTSVQATGVSVKFSDEDEWAELGQEDGTYRKAISAEDTVSGNYLVRIEAGGYENYEESVRFEKDGDNKITATVDMGEKKQYALSGVVRANTAEGMALQNVTVVATKDGKEYRTTTNQQGSYTLMLTQGTYSLAFSLDGYKTEQLSAVEVSAASVRNILLKQAYELNLHITGADKGEFTVKVNDNQESHNFIDGDNKFTIYYGDMLEITAKAKEENIIEKVSEGFEWKVVTASYVMTMPVTESVQYELKLVKSTQVRAIYDGNGVTLNPCMFFDSNIMWAYEGIVTINAEKNGFSARQWSGSDGWWLNGVKYYPVVTGDTVECISFTNYRFNAPGEADIHFEKDENAPVISVSGNETGELYTNKDMTVWLDVVEQESGIRGVSVKIDTYAPSPISAKDATYSFDVKNDKVSTDPSGSLITFTATDNVGNIGQNTLKVYYDENAPVVNAASLDESVQKFVQRGQIFVNRQLDVNVEAEDDFGKLKNIRYYVSSSALTASELATRLDDFVVWDIDGYNEADNTYSVTMDPSKLFSGMNYVYFTVEDKAGNVQTEQYALCAFAVDDQAPSVKELNDVSEHQGAWKKTSDSVSVNGIVEDGETPSGLSYLYKLTAADAAQPDVTVADPDWVLLGDTDSQQQEYAYGQEIQHDGEDGSYKVWIWAKDGCNNISEPNSWVLHVDGTFPKAEKLQFVVTENGELADRVFARKYGNFFHRQMVKGKTEEVILKVSAQDVSSATYVGDNYGIKDIKLYYALEKEYAAADNYIKDIQTADALPQFSYMESPVSVEDGVCTFKFDIPSQSQFYRIMVAVIDKAGNCAYTVPEQSGYTSDLVMLDQVAPKVKVTIDESYATPDYIQKTSNGSIDWYRAGRDVAYKISLEDNESGLAYSNIAINDSNIVTENYAVSTPDSMVKAKEYQPDISLGKMARDGHYKFDVSVADNAGNITEWSQKIFIDNDAPVITKAKFSRGGEDKIENGPLQYAFFFEKATYVTVTATDFIGSSRYEGSGVETFTYYRVDADGKKSSKVELEAKKKAGGQYTARFLVPKNFKGQIYVCATDKVGQKCAYVHPKGTVIETEAEHKKYAKANIVLPQTSYKDAEGNPLYNEEPTIRFETEDIKTGIAKDVWSVKTYGGETEGNGTVNITSEYNRKTKKWKAVLTGDKTWKIPSKLDLNLVKKANRNYQVLSESNHITAALKMTDNVGYTTKAKNSVFSVDVTAPVITMENDNPDVYNEKYYNKEVNFTVTVEDANFSEEDCVYTITGPDANISPWEHVAGDGCDGKVHVKICKWKSVVSFVQDGEYSFAFQCKDRAGWLTEYEKIEEFIIDKTNPAISVEYDNHDAKNEYYYKEQRTATIQIEEKNFKPEDVEIIMTARDGGREIATPQINGWSVGEETHTARITYDYDGEFTFQIAYTDQANNEADPYEQDHFVVDMTAPEVKIMKIEDGSANNKEVQPVVTVKDTNLVTNAEGITLTGVNRGKTDFTYTKVTEGGVLKYTLDDMPRKHEMDDLYTLQAKIVDKAGNETEESVTYSVNRFGSVYVFDEKTQKLLDNVYCHEEQDLVVSEINVDILTESEITYSKDGQIVQLVEGENYEVSQSGDENSWKKYDYRISADNFTEEGRYIVTIYSKDRAANASDNKVKGKEIEFVVDKTKPSVLVSGIEDRGQYNEETRSVTINVEDNIGLSIVEVYNDGKKVAEFTKGKLEELQGSLVVSLSDSNNWQELKVITRDMAGNEVSSDTIKFLLTTNVFVQWYRNIWAFGGTIILLLILAGVVVVLYQRKKKQVA